MRHDAFSHGGHESKLEVTKEIEKLLGPNYHIAPSIFHKCSLFALKELRSAIKKRVDGELKYHIKERKPQKNQKKTNHTKTKRRLENE